MVMENTSPLHKSEKTLDDLSTEEVERLIPLVVYLSVVCMCGVLGNSLVFYVYKTKYNPSNCRSFVLYLSTIDLFTSLVVTPIEITIVLKEYKFTLEILCKLSLFLNIWTTVVSGSMLLTIAVDRYRKVCKPFDRQIPLNWARNICIFNTAFAVGFSLLSTVIYGVNEYVMSPYNVTVSECTIKNSMKGTMFPLINNVMFGILFLGGLSSMFILYYFVGIKVRKYSTQSTCQQSQQRLKTHKTAYIMFLISLAFALTYLPVLALLLARSINSKFVPGLNDQERAIYKFCLRSYYLGCMLNPVIYGIWDERFRNACRGINRW